MTAKRFYANTLIITLSGMLVWGGLLIAMLGA